MVDGVAELGVLTASAEEWAVAVRRAEVIGRLAREPRVRIPEADEAAAELGISRRQVYGLLKRWRAGSGVASDLFPRRSSGGRGRGRIPEEVEALLLEVIRSQYLTKQRRTVTAVYKEVVRQCRIRGLPAPSRGTLERRIGQLDPVASVTARQGADAARALPSLSDCCDTWD
jgi:putative transposase